MIKKILIAIFVIGLIFSFGCRRETPKTPGGESPYIGGSKGIVAEFVDMGIYNEGSNMNEIFEGETFPIEVLLMNKGEYDVGAGEATVSLLGINLADFSGIVGGGELSNSDVIEKISNYNEEGGEETLDFTPGAEDALYLIDLVGSSYDISVFGKVVFRYKTYTSVPKVCFKEDLTDESVCEVDEEKKVYSSAAPIQVKKAVEKRAGSGKIAVEFSIENVGDGDVALPGEDFDSRYDQLAFEISDADDWECKVGGRTDSARLDSGGKATIICKLKEALPEDTLYTKQLDLTLMYDYKVLIHEQVRIKKE